MSGHNLPTEKVTIVTWELKKKRTCSPNTLLACREVPDLHTSRADMRTSAKRAAHLGACGRQGKRPQIISRTGQNTFQSVYVPRVATANLPPLIHPDKFKPMREPNRTRHTSHAYGVSEWFGRSNWMKSIISRTLECVDCTLYTDPGGARCFQSLWLTHN